MNNNHFYKSSNLIFVYLGLLTFISNSFCQSNLLIGIIILLIHLDDTAMKDMIEEGKWKNFWVFTDAFIHWLQSNSNIFEKNSNYRRSEKESHES